MTIHNVQETPSDSRSCPLCEAIQSPRPLIEDELSVVVPDVFPVSPGHHLIVTRRHEPNFFQLSNAEVISMMRLLQRVERVINEKWTPDGFNLGVNVGPAAGQTISHVHLHIIPRYKGDVEDPRGGVRHVLPGSL